MSTAGNVKCFTKDGKLAFYAKGNVPFLCSSDTCGPNGRAEFGCEYCCGWPYGSTTTSPVLPAAKSSTDPMVIAASVSGCILLAVALILLIYCMFKKFLWKKDSCHDEESGLVQGDSVRLSMRPCSSTQVINENDHGQVTMSGHSSVTQPSDDEDLTLSQQPSDSGEDGGSRAVDGTSSEQAVIVLTNERVVWNSSDSLYTGMVSNGSVSV